MTIEGDNTYVNRLQGQVAAMIADNETSIYVNDDWCNDAATPVADELFAEFLRTDVRFDTTTGIVSFPHPAGGEVDRNMTDWVSAQMHWRGTADIVWDAMPNILQQLCGKVIEQGAGESDGSPRPAIPRMKAATLPGGLDG